MADLLCPVVIGREAETDAGLVHQAVTVVPAGELTASFHWLATGLAEAADAPDPPDCRRRRRCSAGWRRATGSRATPPPCSRR